MIKALLVGYVTAIQLQLTQDWNEVAEMYVNDFDKNGDGTLDVDEEVTEEVMQKY